MLLFKSIRRLRQRLANRYALKTLLDADEHLLKDIGITREEVIRAHQLPLWKDPAVAVKRMSKERKLSVSQRPPPMYTRRPLTT